MRQSLTFSSLTGRRDTQPYDNLKESTWQLFKNTHTKKKKKKVKPSHAFIGFDPIYKYLKKKNTGKEPALATFSLHLHLEVTSACFASAIRQKKPP